MENQFAQLTVKKKEQTLKISIKQGLEYVTNVNLNLFINLLIKIMKNTKWSENKKLMNSQIKKMKFCLKFLKFNINIKIIKKKFFLIKFFFFTNFQILKIKYIL